MSKTYHGVTSLLIVLTLVLALYHSNSIELKDDVKCNYLAPKRISISFDDVANIEYWNNSMDFFEENDVRATFFIDRFDKLSEEKIEILHSFNESGHEIGLHGLNHRGYIEYISDGGTAESYFDSEVITAKNMMESEGFLIESFAYPKGQRDGTIDELIQEEIPLVRGVRGNPENIHSWFTTCLDMFAFRSISITDSQDNIDDVTSIIENHDSGTLFVYSHQIDGNGDSVSTENLTKLFDTVEENEWEWIQYRDLANMKKN